MSFLDVIMKASQGNLDAENALMDKIHVDYQISLFECMKVYLSRNNDVSIRVASTKILIAALKEQHKHTNTPLWSTVEKKFAEDMKQELIAMLNDKNRHIMEATCDLAANLYVVEIFHNGWPKLIGSMIQIIKEWKNLELIEPSIRLLGTICELVQTFEVDVKKVDIDDIDSIVGSLTLCLEQANDNIDIKLKALTSLRNASGFIAARIDVKTVREYVLDRLLHSLEVRHEDVVCLTYQVLIELVKAMYPYWYQILGHVVKMSKPHLESKSAKAVTNACEFWSALAAEENYRRQYHRGSVNDDEKCKNYMEQYFADIMPPILLNLGIFSSEESNSGSSAFEACLNALWRINEGLKDSIITMYTEFIDMCMKEKTVQSKIAALSSYMCMVKTITKMSCFNLLSESFQNLIQLLEDPDISVRRATCRLLYTIAECQAETMLTPNILKPYLQGFIRMIESCDEFYSVAMCEMFEKLVEGFAGVNNQNAFLIESLPDLVNATLQCSFYPVKGSDMKIQSAATTCLAQLVINCFDWQNMKEFYDKFLAAVEEASKVPFKDHRLLLMEALFLCLGMMIFKTKNAKQNLSDETKVSCYKAAVLTMQKEKTIVAEGIFLMGAVACIMKQDFRCYLDEYLSYIREGVSNSKNDQVISASFDSLSTFCRENDYISRDILGKYFIPEALDRMNNMVVPIEDRINLFTTIGDISLGNLDPVLDNLQSVLQNYENAFIGTANMLVIARDVE